MKTKYLMGTAVGGLMEMPDWRFDSPFDIIEADSVEDAVREYNKRHNCSYFYGYPMCEITADGECVGIDISTSRQMCEDILKYLMAREIVGTCELCGKLIYDDNDFHMDDEGVEMCDKCYQESLQEEIMPND